MLTTERFTDLAGGAGGMDGVDNIFKEVECGY